MPIRNMIMMAYIQYMENDKTNVLKGFRGFLSLLFLLLLNNAIVSRSGGESIEGKESDAQSRSGISVICASAHRSSRL